MKKEYFCKTDSVNHAGTHLIIEVWDAKNIDCIKKVKKTLIDAVSACKATLLRVDLHQFSPYGGISGMAIISESHISIHSWPEFSYAALDVFVCGDVDPYKSIAVFRERFETKNIQVMEIKRGILEVHGEKCGVD